jgi:hypothetical protein
MLRYAACFHRKIKKKKKKIKFQKKNLKIKKKIVKFYFLFFLAINIPHPIWGLPGLAVKGIRTNSTKRLSQIII